MNTRKHFVTLCLYDNTEVTYIKRKNGLEVTFEKAINKGFCELVVNIDGEIIKNNGFNDAEVGRLIRFLEKNKKLILEEATAA